MQRPRYTGRSVARVQTARAQGGPLGASGGPWHPTWAYVSCSGSARCQAGGGAAGVSGMRAEHLKLLLQDVTALELLARFRRLVSRALTKGWADTFDEATHPYQFALQARAGADALAAHVRTALEQRPQSARYGVLAQCGHHCFSDGRAARHCNASIGHASIRCRFRAAASDTLAHALLDCSAHTVLRRRWARKSRHSPISLYKLFCTDDDVNTARDIMHNSFFHNIQYVHAVCSQAEACKI